MVRSRDRPVSLTGKKENIKFITKLKRRVNEHEKQ